MLALFLWRTESMARRWDLPPNKNRNESFMQGGPLNHLWSTLIELCDELMRGTGEVPNVVSENLRELDCRFHLLEGLQTR